MKPLDAVRGDGHLAVVTNYNQRYAFVTTHALDTRRGGVRAQALMAFMEALSRRGKQIGLVTPSSAPPLGPAARWWFNRHLPRTLSPLVVDAVIGIDGDGYRFARASRSLRFVAYLLGNQADNRRGPSEALRRPRAREVAWEARAARDADLVVTPSRYLAGRAEAQYGIPADRIAVVPLGVDGDRWPYVPADRSEHPVVLLLGEPDAEFPRLWNQVLSRCPHARLAVARYAGTGARSRPQTQAGHPAAGAPSQVHVLSIEAMRASIRDATIVYVSDHAERQGLGPLEAMATGRAIVATRVGSIPEMVGDAAILVSPGDARGVVHALHHLLDAPDECRRLGQRARERALERSWAVAAQEFGAALAEL